MSWFVDKLRNNRIAGVISQIERGEEVDWAKLDLLQSLDLVDAGMQHLADALERDQEADERAIAEARARQG
jgi:hypothetical protein